MEDLNVGGGQSAAQVQAAIAAAGGQTEAQVTSTVNAAITAQVNTANASAVKTALNAAGNAPVYANRTWGLTDSTNALLGGGNISSITDAGTGAWVFNYITAVPANSSPQATAIYSGYTGNLTFCAYSSSTTSCGIAIALRSTGAGIESGCQASLVVVG